MTTEYDPPTLEAYNAKATANCGAFGRGILGVGMRFACPGCAEPGWAAPLIIHAEEELARAHSCARCGRTFRVETVHEGGTTTGEFVQLGGDDIPAYLPPMRRVPR